MCWKAYLVNCVNPLLHVHIISSLEEELSIIRARDLHDAVAALVWLGTRCEAVVANQLQLLAWRGGGGKLKACLHVNNLAYFCGMYACGM